MRGNIGSARSTCKIVAVATLFHAVVTTLGRLTITSRDWTEPGRHSRVTSHKRSIAFILCEKCSDVRDFRTLFRTIAKKYVYSRFRTTQSYTWIDWTKNWLDGLLIHLSLNTTQCITLAHSHSSHKIAIGTLSAYLHTPRAISFALNKNPQCYAHIGLVCTTKFYQIIWLPTIFSSIYKHLLQNLSFFLLLVWLCNGTITICQYSEWLITEQTLLEKRLSIMFGVLNSSHSSNISMIVILLSSALS